MKRSLFIAVAVVALAARGAAVDAQLPVDPNATRQALRQAIIEQRMAAARSARFEAEAAGAVEAADKTARQTAALAARIQQAEAGISAAQARIALVDRERAALREQLGSEQEPVVHLTAALQQFTRRPIALAILRPGSVKQLIYTRALLSSAIPVVRQRTGALRAQLARSRDLRRQATIALVSLREETGALTSRRQQLAGIETRQRLASRDATGSAAREGERAMALGEQARDLDARHQQPGELAL